MARELHYNDLCEILATKCYVSEITIERVIENLILLIASELQNNSYIRIKNLGKFSIEQRGGTDEWIQDEFGTLRKRYVSLFDYVNFEPSNNLLDVINGEGLDYFFRKVKMKYDKPIPFENIVEENTQEDLTDEIKTIISKRKIKKETKKDRKEMNLNSNLSRYNETKQQPILCKNNNVIYPSLYRASVELGISYHLLRKHCLDGETNYKVSGYDFKILPKEGEKENGKV